MRCLLVLAKERFRECGQTNVYSANIEFNVSAHGEHIRERKAPTENSNNSLLLRLLREEGGVPQIDHLGVAHRVTDCVGLHAR